MPASSAQFASGKRPDAFESACSILFDSFDGQSQASRLRAVDTTSYKDLHKIAPPGPRPWVTPGDKQVYVLPVAPHTEGHQRYNAQLCKIGLHGFHLDVNIHACCARRLRKNPALKRSESMAGAANPMATPLAASRLRLRTLLARTFRNGHSSGATFEELYSLAATRETSDHIESGTMADA